MKAFHWYILGIVGVGVTANMLAIGSIVMMMNASLIGLGIWVVYHFAKKARNKIRTTTVDLGKGKTFLLTPKKNTAI